MLEELDVLMNTAVAQLTSFQRQRLAEHGRSGAVEVWLAAVRERKRKLIGTCQGAATTMWAQHALVCGYGDVGAVLLSLCMAWLHLFCRDGLP